MTSAQLDVLILVAMIALDVYLLFDLARDVYQWRVERKRKASEALLQIALDSYIPCPDEACEDCGQETYGEDHACAFLTTQDVSLIQRSSESSK